MIYTVYYPDNRISEFEIQSDLYQELKQQGFDVRGEVKAKQSRLDIVVFNEQKKAVCIVEVKSQKKERTTQRKYKRVAKYEELFKLPVLTCLNRNQITEIVNEVKGIINA